MFSRLLQELTKYCITLIGNSLNVLYVILLPFFTLFFINLGHPRKTREASKMIIGQTQNIKPDKNGVCPCPICPKGNLIINSLFFALF